MKILFCQFAGQLHSWSTVCWGLAKCLTKDHEVDIFATDGIKHLPEQLKKNVIGYTELNQQEVFGRVPRHEYDMQFSYTSMKNFPLYLQYGNKNRFGMWCYEWGGKNILPIGFAKNYRSCDKLLTPSNYAKKVFIDSGIPERAINILPHGIDGEKYIGKDKITDIDFGGYKILAILSQPHIRKNISGLLDAYGKAFTKKDDVCLILKASRQKEIKMPFEVSINNCISNFYFRYPNHAPIKIIYDFIEDMSILYRSCDSFFTMSHCECFLFPALESIASGKISICPNHGGQLDFLNENNSLLIDGKETRSEPKSMYWEVKDNALWFQPSMDDAVDKLRYSYGNFEKLNKIVEDRVDGVIKEYSWENITNKLLDMVEEK